MLFSTPQFGIFLVALLVVYWTAPERARRGILLGASLVFYTLWLPAYLLLLLGDIAANYALLRAIARGRRPRLYLTLSIVLTLGLLAWFKYAAMAIGTLLPIIEPFGALPTAIPQVFLPLGISFYSFQIIALAVDVYRGEIDPPERFARYALFVSFFPQLIAGPILRGHQFLPQLARGGRVDVERLRRGLWLIAVGLFKKVVLADWMLSGFVDTVFARPTVASAPYALIALYGFAFQIYYDFSGYTNMARGIACLFGFELPANFTEPYLSRSPREFWRRWHITLSRWLSDYLYVPLGGNRSGTFRTYRNLMLTMLLGGLWHGAAWTFVLWGGLHGLLLVMHRLFGRRDNVEGRPLAWRDAPRVLVVFHLVCLAWVFFRAENVDHAFDYLAALFTGGNAYGWPIAETLWIGLCVVLHLVERLLRQRAPALRVTLRARWWGGMLEGATIGALIGFAAIASGAGGDFLYFQF